MYIYLNGCKQMTDVKLLQSYNNTWNHWTVYKRKWAQARLKKLSTKCLWTSYLFSKEGFDIK